MFKRKWVLLFLLVVGIVLIVFSFLPKGEVAEIEASDFYSQLSEGQIAEVFIQNEVVISGKYTDGGEFETYCSLALYSNISELFLEKEVQVVDSATSSGGFSLYIFPIMMVGFLVFLIYSFRKAQKGPDVFGSGKSQAVSPGQVATVTFADVAGADESKQELQEVIDFLKGFDTFRALGAKIPRGVLLMGPPGTGKTLMARAVAGETGVPFFAKSGTEFVEMFVGRGASRVRELFDQAKRNAPCIIFIDEIDAVGGQRGLGFSSGEKDQTLQQILVEMDGFSSNANIIVIAATNRPEALDLALLRPGRFDRRVVLDLPDIVGRKAILEVHARGKPLEDKVNLETVAKQTSGFCGADLANLINEAAILSGRRKKKQIGMQELEESIDKVLMGPERKSRKIGKKEKQITAYHEAGHALVAKMLRKADPVHKISIVARGMAGGYTKFLPTKDRYLITRSQFEAMLATLLGGYMAEELIFKESSTGPGNDLERATKISYKMVTEYGMSKALGPRTFGRREKQTFLGRETEEKNYSEEVAQKIDAEIQKFIDAATEKAKSVLKKNQAKLEQIAKRLLIEETIEGEKLEKLFAEPVDK